MPLAKEIGYVQQHFYACTTTSRISKQDCILDPVCVSVCFNALQLLNNWTYRLHHILDKCEGQGCSQRSRSHTSIMLHFLPTLGRSQKSRSLGDGQRYKRQGYRSNVKVTKVKGQIQRSRRLWVKIAWKKFTFSMMSRRYAIVAFSLL